MIKLFRKMHHREWWMIGLCVLLIIGQIYYELKLPDYMSDLTVLIETPGSTMEEILDTGKEMLVCTAISAVLSIICGDLSARVAGGLSYTVRKYLFNKI